MRNNFMKKGNTFVLAAALLVLTACGEENNVSVQEVGTAQPSLTEESVSEAPLETSGNTEAESETETEAMTEKYADTVLYVEAESVSAADYKTLYKEKLSEIRETEEYEPSMFTFDLYDIDCDGSPELFTADGNYHAAMVTIYTVRDGEVKKLSNPSLGDEYSGFGSWGTVQVAEGGYIASRYFGMGSGFNDYFRFINGELIFLASSELHLLSDENGEECYRYVIDENEVSETEYNEGVMEYEAMEWTDVGQGYRFFDMDEADKVIDAYGE